MAEENRIRDKKIQFWVTENERDYIDERANYCDLSRSDYLRKMALEGAIIKREYEGIVEVNKIGVNINQIAKRVNTRGSVLERDVEELRVQYEKLFEVVYGKIISG